MDFLQLIKTKNPQAKLNSFEKRASKATLKNLAEIFKKDEKLLELYLKIRNESMDKRLKEINKFFNVNTNAYDFSLEERGLFLGLTRERVRQIEESALKKMKKFCLNKCDIYKEFLYK